MADIDFCTKQVANVFKMLKQTDIEGLAKQVQEILNNADVTKREVKEVFEEAFKQHKIHIEGAIKEKLATAEKFEVANGVMYEQFAKDPLRGIRAMITPQVGGAYQVPGTVDGIKRNIVDTALAIVQNTVNKEGVQTRAASGELDDAIYRYIMSEGKDTSNMDAATIAVAKSIRKANAYLLQRKQQAAFSTKELSDYVIGQYHPQRAMLAMGKEKWIAEIDQHLDWDRMGVVDINERMELLDNIYQEKNLYAGRSFWEVDPDFSAIKVNRVAKRMSRGRKLHFLPGAYVKYSKAMGMGSLMDQMVRGMDRQAGQIAAATMFGPNYVATFNQLIKTAADLGADVSSKRILFEKRMFEAVVAGGDNDITAITAHSFDKNNKLKSITDIGNALAVNVFDKGRKLTNVAFLGKAIATTLTDIPFGAGIIQASTGKNFFQTMVPIAFNQAFLFSDQVVSNILNTRLAKKLGIKDRTSVLKYTSARLGLFMEDNISTMAADRFMEGASGHKTSLFNRAHQSLMELTGLPLQSRSVRMSIAKMASESIADYADHSYDELYQGMRDLLGRHGIDAKKWEIMKRSIDRIEDTSVFRYFGKQVDLVTPQAVYDMVPDNIFTEVGYSKKDIPRIKNEVADGITGILNHMANRGSPGHNVEWAAIRDIFDPNTIHGQLMRSMMQFKSFIYGVGKTMLDIHTMGSGNKRYGNLGLTAQVAVSASILGAGVKVMQDSMNGIDVTDEKYTQQLGSKEFFFESIIRGGSLSFLGDYAFTNYTKRNRSFAGDIAGPFLSSMGNDVMNLWSTALHSPSKTYRKRETKGDTLIKKALEMGEKYTPPVIPIVGPIFRTYMFNNMHQLLNTGKKERDRWYFSKD